MKYADISHFSHPIHYLRYDYTEKPFQCDGCNKVGIGSRCRCSNDHQICDFDLHAHWALPSASIIHPFYKICTFQFLAKPPGNERRSSCKKYNLHVACVREMLLWRIGGELYKGERGKSIEGKSLALKNTLEHHHRSSSEGKVQKCCEIAGMAVQFVISAVLGDQTALIAGVVGSLISRG
ncbi:unnamed protein product [Eruca vesicaria subsp. sativa]|uniref:DC1 domain-containing protein n=1 Tax=Eruca vesicaria subsp. sativa TaxID=29727 RepID=A0ABC8INA7_ERUVS|nr:unnamed protein product [Eruca vesicaria subsp. sativa]